MIRTCALLVFACVLASGGAHAAETLRYVALVAGGTQAGHQSVTRGDDGVTRVEFVFKDNGRGPELTEEYELADDGTYRRYSVRGTSTFGAPVDESFVREGDRARWTSTSDKGAMDVEGTALYSPLGGSPDVFSVALGALAGRPDGAVPLLPGGTLRVRALAEAQVARGNEQRIVQLMAVTGVGFTPQFAWATTGDAPRLFAYIFPGFLQLVEEGWENNADVLEERQKTEERKALADMRGRLAQPLPGTTLVRNARVFDSESARLGEPSDLLLRDGRIVSVSAAGGEAPATDHVIDAGGRVLLPGLIDMHVHAGRWDGGLHLASGVTTVRDMGNDNATLQEIMREERDGALLSPRLLAAGFIEGESAMSSRGGFVIEDLAGAREAIDWYAGHGYPQVKIYNSFPKELLRDTAAYAHGKGLRVSGHVPAFMRAEEVVEQGYDELQHINQVVLNFLVKPDTDTRTLDRFYLVAKEAGDLDLDSKPVQDFIALLVEKKVVVDPTLATFEFLYQRDGEMSPIFAPIEDHVPPDVRRQRRVAEMDIPDAATAARYKASFDVLVDFVGRMHRAGVPIVAGTDEIPGFTLHRELELYVDAGMSPAEALQAATWTAAGVAGVRDDRGVIAPGMRADLVLIDGDPTRSIGDIRRIALVVKGSEAYAPAAIHAELGVGPLAPPVVVQPGAAKQARGGD